MPHLIAVAGLPGAGKSEVARYFTDRRSYYRVYFGGLTRKILEEEKLQCTEINECQLRERLRSEHGPAAYATLNLPEIWDALKSDRDVVIDGLYSWEEYVFLKERFETSDLVPDGLVVIAVWAPPQLRYRRLANRSERPLTLEEARSRDYSQIANLNQGGPIAMSDVMLRNNGTLEGLFRNTLDKLFID